ncbi:MAG: hypothetical protein D3924_01580 [Candidatus Electrothrix sp. AR4]|nr:hypothetical protein [Candidatus Electrothrix sp. AR4]
MMNKIHTNPIASVAIPLGVVSLFIYIILRAWFVGFTHDESLTFTIVNGDNFWVLTANNHWLNTILSYLSAKMFGYSELAMRLPNVVCFPLYSYFCFKLVVRHSKSIAATLISVFFLLFNHYLLEFFSLSRGYGLALACFSGALYYFIQLSQDRIREQTMLAKGIIFSLLAIYANYAFVIPIAAIQFAYLVCLFKNSKHQIFTLKPLLWFLCELLLLLPALQNILVLKERKQLYFGGTDNVINDTLFSLFRLTFHVEYIQNQKWVILAVILMVVIVSLFIKNMDGLFFIGLVFIISLLFPVILHYSINMKYPLGRAGLYWIVIIGVLFHKFLEYISEKQQALKFLSFSLLACMTLAATISTGKAMNLQYARSWRGDADTRAMLEFLEIETRNRSRNCNLMTNWYYSAAVNYYRISKGYNWLNTASRKDWLIAANRKAINATSHDYIYLSKNKQIPMNNKEYIKNFATSNSALIKNMKFDGCVR